MKFFMLIFCCIAATFTGFASVYYFNSGESGRFIFYSVFFSINLANVIFWAKEL